MFYNLNCLDNIKYISPIDFINNYDNEKIDINTQKDASEFILNFLDKLDNKLLNT